MVWQTRSRLVAVTIALVGLALVPRPALAAGDPALASQWGLHQIHAPAAWPRTTGAGVRIGIVDTGVDLANDELAGKIVATTSCVVSGGTAAGCRGSAQDDSGHGTQVAATAAAVRGNGKGGAGVAPDAEVVVAKVFTALGTATVDDVAVGIKWVVDHGARVVNLSLSGSQMTFTPGPRRTTVRAALDYAWSRGAVPVLAAGDYQRLGIDLADPAARDIHAVVVGATGPDGHMAPDSAGTGTARLGVLAPGAVRDGTSIAAAHVSGTIALLLGQGYNRQGAVERLLLTADGTVSCGMWSPSCYGLIDAAKATSGPVQPASR